MLKTLEIAFAEMDADVLARQTEWALARRAALIAFKSSDEFKAITDVWVRYDRLFNLCGGKNWYGVINGNNETGIREFVAKNCAATAIKRNVTIIAKLQKLGVTEIDELKFSRTSDGFHGLFVFDKARIEIRTILAGGYNIQCLHQRTLVKAAR